MAAVAVASNQIIANAGVGGGVANAIEAADAAVLGGTIEKHLFFQQAIAIGVEVGLHFIEDLAEDDVVAQTGVHAGGIDAGSVGIAGGS